MLRHTLAMTFDRIITGLHAVGTGLVFVLMGMIVVDVLGRAGFNRPLTGTPELVKVTLVTLLFLGLAKTWQQGRHIKATVLVERASPSSAIFLTLFADICNLTVFVLLAYSSWDLMIEAWRTMEYEGAGALRVPVYPLRTLIVVSSTLCVIQLCRHLIQDVRRWRNPTWR